MNFTVVTIFPEMFRPFWEHGIVQRAIEGNKIRTDTVNIRDFASDRHRTTDDRPYGGGCGMVMKPEPLAGAIRQAMVRAPDASVVSLSPQGRRFDQAVAREFAARPGLILVCGRYEGIDERICGSLIGEEVSIGDYVLTGGELAAMVVMDAVTRLIPGTLGGADSAALDSFADGLLEHAHYTRPPEFEGERVPEVLLSGNHGAIDAYRRESALVRTFLKRPDLFRERTLEEAEIRILEKWRDDLAVLIDENRNG